jgi:hypothetical protein
MRPCPTHFRAVSLFVGASLLAALAASACPQSDSMFGPLPVFEFHSGFWVNLHHTLYQEAKARITPPDHQPGKYAHPAAEGVPLPRPALTPVEQRAWNDAVNYYAANYATRDLLFSTDLVVLKNQLGDFEDCDELSGTKKKSCDAGLPADITRLLEAAGVVYRAHTWPEHDRANRRWIAGVAPLVRDLAQKQNSRGRLRLRQLVRRVYHPRSAARDHFQLRPSQSGFRRARGLVSRSFAWHRRAGRAGHHARMQAAR